MTALTQPNPRSPLGWLVVCAAAVAIAGCMAAPGKPGPEPEVPRPEQVLDFSKLYAQNCSACHGENGKNGAAISLANPVYLAIAGASNIQRVTAAGVPGTAMPPFGKSAGGMLTDEQIAILAEGMVSTWGNPSALAGQSPPAYASSAPGDPAHGQHTFATYCAQCHGADGTGGISPSRPPASSVIPPAMSDETPAVHTGSLIDPSYLALVSDQALRSFIVAGQTEQGAHDWSAYVCAPTSTTLVDRQITNPAVVDQQITDVVAWLASHRTATPGQVYQPHP